MSARPPLSANLLTFSAFFAVCALACGCTVETLVPGSGEPPPAAERDDAAAPSPSDPVAPPAPLPSREDAGAGEGGAPPGSEAAEISLRATGDCAPEFRDLVVATNTSTFDSIAVSNGQAPMSGSFQLALPSGRRSFTLSTRDRTEERDVLNVMATYQLAKGSLDDDEPPVAAAPTKKERFGTFADLLKGGKKGR